MSGGSLGTERAHRSGYTSRETELRFRPGVAVGRELRRHLVNQGVAKQQALAISRDHFIVESVDSELKLQDLDSTGGTVLDGTRLPLEQWISLADGDEVMLSGELRGRFEVA